ncbi:polyketide synthase [Xylaria telfairii]|nr:polyketide synthase [Xylaria telfairii]
MGRSLLKQSAPCPAFRDSIRVSQKILDALGATWDLEDELLSEDLGNSRVNTAELAQPLTTAVQIALIALLCARGVRPQAVVGHSSGEIAAAFMAGYLTHRTALAVSFHRGFMRSASISQGLPRGGMISVAIGESDVEYFTKDLTKGVVTTACINSPKSVTLSGDAAAIDELTSQLASEGNVRYRRLLLDTAYHSRHMDAVADDYRCRIKDLDYSTPGNTDITFVSSVTGEIKTTGFDSSYWVANLVSPVRFYDAIKTLGHQYLAATLDAHEVFIEIGPHPALSGVVRQSLENVLTTKQKLDYTSPLRRDVDAVSSYLDMIGCLFQYGVNINPDWMFQPTPTLRNASILTGLPSYSWDYSKKHWYESRISKEYRQRREPYHDLLGVRIIDSSPVEPRWRHIIDISSLPWLSDHVIDDLVVFPGSAYLCMVFEALLQLCRESYPSLVLENIVVRNVAFLRALVVASPPMRQEMQLSLKPSEEGNLAFDYSITALTDSKWYEYCTGTVEGVLLDRNNVEAAIYKMPNSSIRETPSTEIIELGDHEIYAELSSTGNQYGKTFMGCTHLKLELNTSQTEAEITIPDVGAVMPARYQRRHLIHPATLDIILHTALPMAKLNLGLGSIVPVSIDELLISAGSDVPRDPGQSMQVSASLISTGFRTSHVNMRATAGTQPVLSVSGLELRSTAPSSDPTNTATEAKDICYTLDWQPDVDFMRSRDLSHCTNFKNLFRLFCFKRANLSILEFSEDYKNLSSSILKIVDTQDGTLSSYTCVIPWRLETPQFPTDSPTVDTRVQFVTFNSESNLSEPTLQQQSCDVVLITAIEDLARASTFVNMTGILMILIDKRRMELQKLTSLVQDKLSSEWSIMLAYHDFTLDRLVVVVRYHAQQRKESSRKLCILTHSPRQSTPNWVDSLYRHFRSRPGDVSLRQMDEDAIADVGPETCFLVLDDCPVPIISDPQFFHVITRLLRQPARILWVCPNIPIQMYQITGLSRTAHAENGQLRLIIVHTAQNMFDGVATDSRLAEILTSCLDRIDAGHTELQPEREYRIRADGTVLVHRLQRDRKLSRVIAGECDTGIQTQMRPFVDPSRPLTLSYIGRHGIAYFDTYFNSTPASLDCLRDDELEIETRSILLTKACRTASFGVHAGTVARIGSAVKTFAPNDRVVAIGTAVGLSRPQVRQSRVINLPLPLSFSQGAAFLLHVLSACYALHQLARLKSSARVLVSGAMTIAGRAIIAVAQTIGARVFVLVSDRTEASSVASALCLPTEQVLISRPSLYKQTSQCKDQLKLDTIVQTGSLTMPFEILSLLKPFGNIIVMESAISLWKASRIPRNTTVHSFDIEEVFTSNPDAIEYTIAKASIVIKNLSTRGLTFVTRDVSQVNEAVHLLDTGVQDDMVLDSELDSTAPCTIRDSTRRESWACEDASYVVAGGLGDLGRRLLILMARRGAKHLVTLSRRTISDCDHRNLQAQLEKIRPGCQLYCLSCDITSEPDLRKIPVTLARLGVPSVRGVIQSAAILQDRTLDLMTYNDFLIASQIKVDGTLALKSVFASPQLCFFIMLSSAANIIGTSGQGNYNAGNAVQDAMAHDLNDTSCHFISLNIGWIENAEVTVNNEQRRRGLSRAGLQSITSSQLLLFLDHVLGVAMEPTRSAQMVIGFSTESLSRGSQASGNGNVESALFRHVYNPAQLGPSSSVPDTLSFKALASKDDQNILLDLVADSIANKLTQLISTDALRILHENLSILELGLDSLIAIELRNWIMREFEAPLQSSEVILDQTIRMLAEKVISRFRANAAAPKAQQSAMVDQQLSDQSKPGLHLNGGRFMPTLANTLQLFQESRYAVDSESDQIALSRAVTSFLHGVGPKLECQLKELGHDIIAKNYETQIYLQRREPLQDYSLFSIIHPIETPRHSQSMRAALLTAATIEFAESLALGTFASQLVCEMGIRSETQKWLFYTTRRPENSVDQVEYFPPNRTVAVLRRGHVFQLDLGKPGVPLSLSAMESSYTTIIEASDTNQARVCTLTAMERDSWASLRLNLELDPGNAVILSIIDKSAFVVCLDDELPSTSGERLTQFLINGPRHPFSNRWLDKPVQLAVTANGVSGGIHEHSKIDGLDVRALHRHLIRVLMASGENGSSELAPSEAYSMSYRVRKFTWNPGSELHQHLTRLEASFKLQSSPYITLGHEHVKISSFGRTFLRGRGVSPNATVELIVVLALFLVDGYVRAAWEILSLAGIGGRIDWIQTVSPALREFVEAAAARLRGDATGANGNGESTQGHIRSLCREAARLHSKAVALAAQSHGYVNYLYALRGVLSMAAGEVEEIPAIFQTSAWNATRRGGTGQDVKIGFEPSEDQNDSDGDEGRLYRWKEAGFLMAGDKGIHIHCDVGENITHIYVMGRPGYASTVSKAIEKVAAFMLQLLEQ